MIEPGKFANKQEEDLFKLVEQLAKGAGLEKVPEIGIYEGEDMNAFATGMGRADSIVAFSSGLLKRMEPEGIAAVAGHEISHIANGDMLTLTLIQALVNVVILFILLPVKFMIGFMSFSQDEKARLFFGSLLRIVHFVATLALTFAGSLVVKWFSRIREFKADEGAAALVGKEKMTKALEFLQGDDKVPDEKLQSYAAFRISSPPAFWDLFSTHPGLQRRIGNLQFMESAEDGKSYLPLRFMATIVGTTSNVWLRILKDRLLVERWTGNDAPAEVPYASIRDIRTKDFVGFIPTGLQIEMEDGTSRLFSTYSRSKIVALVREKKAQVEATSSEPPAVAMHEQGVQPS